MLIDSQDDAVNESCSSQFASGSLPPMMASVRAELPRVEVLGKGTCNTIDSRGSSKSSSRACSWRSHIQRDETELPKRVSSEWNTKNSKTRPSASAMVLARKRKRDEQRKLLNSKKQCTDSDGSEYTAGDSEQDSLDMEEQLTAFVEYNATDMDSLDINPSQDFDGDEEQETATQASQHMQTCSWQDVTDVNQFQEEASEVFDNVIYAPRPAKISAGSRTSTHCRASGQEIACPSFLPTAKAIQEDKAVVGPPSDDSEGSLSDGFDVAVNLTNKIKTTHRPLSVVTNCTDSSPTATKPQWRQRRSVKRDCSFIDNASSYSVNGRLLLMASPTPVTTSEASQTSSDSVIELRDGCFDSSDDTPAVPTRNNGVSNSVPTSVLASVDTMMVMSSSLPSETTYSGAIQPRLVRKRRKVGQLTLDGFLRSKMP